MASYKSSRIIPIALILIITAIAIAALVSLARVIFFSEGTSSGPTNVDISREALLDTSADRSVRMIVRGSIVADESFRSYQITVSPSARNLTTYTGYLDNQIDSINLGNNIPAYEQFVYALDKADLSNGTELSGSQNDLRGVCATGKVYEFQILKADKSIKSLWTSTCKGSRGSLDASVSQLTDLFTSQIPDAKATINKIKL
ncbi:MAG TPA: hypothetical protein PK265_02575 [Candidatus Saccharibacteria bacterium]|nr:hypothetical protein [Candidatus Saccharibacteria bacterium]HRQ98183.1 hypothetical protein [Candidatus Saccharibacteria bacterium]